MVARLSGDEFVLLALFDACSEASLEVRAETSMNMVKQTLLPPYRLANREIAVTPSIGYTCFTAATCEHEEVLKQADIAMYRTKSEGRARLCRFEPWMCDALPRLLTRLCGQLTA